MTLDTCMNIFTVNYRQNEQKNVKNKYFLFYFLHAKNQQTASTQVSCPTPYLQFCFINCNSTTIQYTVLGFEPILCLKHQAMAPHLFCFFFLLHDTVFVSTLLNFEMYFFQLVLKCNDLAVYCPVYFFSTDPTQIQILNTESKFDT